MNNISDSLKEIRLSKQLTKTEVSEITGLSTRIITNIENNKHCSFEDVVIYCEALGYILDLKKKKKPTIIIIEANGEVKE